MIREALALITVFIPPATGPATVQGQATWYDDGPGIYAAAGHELRWYLGKHWRGKTVTVCRKGECLEVTITDWCGCPGPRIIDLSPEAFQRLEPLSKGVIRVKIHD